MYTLMGRDKEQTFPASVLPGIIVFHLMRKGKRGSRGCGVGRRSEVNGVIDIEKETRGKTRTKGQRHSGEEVMNVQDGMKGWLRRESAGFKLNGGWNSK